MSEVVSERPFVKLYQQFSENSLEINLQIDDVKEDDADFVHLLHLIAQQKHKQGSYAEILAEIYPRLLVHYKKRNMNPDLFLTNLTACVCLYLMQSPDVSQSIEIVSHFKMPTGLSYEQLYNNSCYLLARQQVYEAYEFAIRAKNACNAQLSPEDAAEESAVLIAQLAYSQQKLHLFSSAIENYRDVLNMDDANEYIIALARFNLLQIQNSSDLMNSYKYQNECASETVMNRLNEAQKRTVEFNGLALEFQRAKTKKAFKALEKMFEKYPDNEMLILCNANLKGEQSNLLDIAKVRFY